MKLKRVLCMVMCVVLTVFSCIYFPSRSHIPTVSAATYEDCGHHNFTRDATDKILICQPVVANASNLTNVSSDASSGFEAGPGLTYNGSDHNQTARISVAGGTLEKLVYSSANSAQKALLDSWSNARGTGNGGIQAAYQISSIVHPSNGWGYDIYLEWDTPIDLSTLTHFYMQFWLVNLGGLSQMASDLTNTKGRLWFNLIATDSVGRTDGWNFPVYLNQLAPDSDGKVNTAHHYTFPISGAQLQSGSLTKIKGLTIRYESQGNGAANAPTIILGKFMTEVPYDNIQTAASFHNASGTAYGSSDFPDEGTVATLRIQGKETQNLVNGIRYPMYHNGIATFVVRLRYGNYTFDAPRFWAWRFKNNRTSGTINVSSKGGAYGTNFQRNNGKYLSDTYHYTYQYL